MEYQDINSTASTSIAKDTGAILIDLPYGNFSILLDNLQTEHAPHANNIAIFAIILSIFSILLNSILLITILFSPGLRYQTSYICVANINVVNIILSVFVTPLAIYLEIGPSWNLGQNACAVWIILDVMLPFVTILILFLLTIDSLFFICKRNFYIASEKPVRKMVFLSTPWILGVCFTLPVWIIGATTLPEIDGVCLYGLGERSSIASLLVTYFVPSFLIIVTIVITLVHILHQNDIDTPPPSSVYAFTSETDQMSKHSSFDLNDRCSIGRIYLACCVFITMWFPHQFVCILLTFCEKCFPPYSVIVGFTWMGASTSFVIPVFFTDAKIRNRIKNFVRRLYVKVAKTYHPEETEIHLMRTGSTT